jgi:hypothetical protein
MAFAIPAAVSLAEILGPTLAAEGPQILALANTIYSTVGKKSASELLAKARGLIASKEGRAQIISELGQGADFAAGAANKVNSFLSKTPLYGSQKAAHYSQFIGKAHHSFQSALGKISKVGHHFGFV